MLTTSGERLFYLSACAPCSNRNPDLVWTPWQQRPISGELYELGLRPGGDGGLGLPPHVLLGTLVAFTVFTLVAAVATTRRR